MDLPKFNETFLPILDVLKDGVVIKSSELFKRVEDRYYSDLPADLLSKTTKSGDRLIKNRIGWGKSYLKQAGMLHYPERGFVQITEKGMSATLEDISSSHLSAKIKSSYKPDDTSGVPSVFRPDASPQDLIDSGVEQIERETKEELLAKLKELDPFAFEKLILVLLKKMGYGDFIETSKTGDGGIDGIINQDQLGLDKIYIQAKRYNGNKVRETDIRNFIGAMSGDTQKGIFVTTSEFDVKAKAKVLAAHHKIILIDGSLLVDMMYKYNVGVQIKSLIEIKIMDNDFFDAGQI